MKKQRLWWALTAAAFLVGLPCGAHSASITVDGSNCHLADAIAAANSNADTGGCIGSGTYGDDTITLQTDVTLAAALPEITTVITIEGGGHFISGNNNSAVGSVLRVASTGNLTVNQATVKNGKAISGGGIYNSGTVTLMNSTVSGNSFSSYGGGIYNSAYGTVTLTNSTVSGNTAFTFFSSSYGGGIYNSAYGTVTLTNSTVSSNSSFYAGGGFTTRMAARSH